MENKINIKRKEMSQGLKDRLKRNKKIFEITLNELEQEKSIGELSYPESVETNMQFKINYKSSIKQIKDSLKRIKKILGLSRAKDSGLIKERKSLLKKHLIILKRLRNNQKKVIVNQKNKMKKEKMDEIEFLKYLINPDKEGKVFAIDDYATEEIKQRIIKKIK